MLKNTLIIISGFALSFQITAQIATTSQGRGHECIGTSTYWCMSPEGDPIGTVGPFKMWWSEADGFCVPSPHRTLKDACIYLTQHCNWKYAHLNRCHGDCLPGSSVTYTLEPSCANSTPISPYQSEPVIRHESWFIK